MHRTHRPTPWHPTADEVARILDEMRPIIADFTRRAAVDRPSSDDRQVRISPPSVQVSHL